VENGVTKYIGITNNFAQRSGEHLRGDKKVVIEEIPGLSQLSRFDARAVEQVLINSTGLTNLINKINTIATSNPIYNEAFQRGTEILRIGGFE
jgi:hypothetical protein